jgi:hypothetical protein
MINDFGNSCITVKKDALLADIRKNFGKHRQILETANVAYRAKAIEELRANLEAAINQKPIRRGITCTEPENHTKEYETVIAMLEMCVADEITITERQFQCFVMDNWDWKSRFQASTAAYIGG